MLPQGSISTRWGFPITAPTPPASSLCHICTYLTYVFSLRSHRPSEYTRSVFFLTKRSQCPELSQGHYRDSINCAWRDISSLNWNKWGRFLSGSQNYFKAVLDWQSQEPFGLQDTSGFKDTGGEVMCYFCMPSSHPLSSGIIFWVFLWGASFPYFFMWSEWGCSWPLVGGWVHALSLNKSPQKGHPSKFN